MEISKGFMSEFSQHHKLPIRLITQDFGHIAPDRAKKYLPAHRINYYFFLLMIRGKSRHGIDTKSFDVTDNELVFILPHQIRNLSPEHPENEYFKIGFDETCLSQLPRQYPFLIDPMNNPKITFDQEGTKRIRSVFEVLLDLLRTVDTDADLLLAHLNALMTEINSAYFKNKKIETDERLTKFIAFKTYVENNFTLHHSLPSIAKELALNTNSLYQIVRHYSGLSPKAFIKSRLVLEAKRRVHYSDTYSVKSLAYELGFNDPEYFSRFFKKETGHTITALLQDSSGN